MLRDLIKNNHDKAEAHRFVKLLLSGKMPTEVYAEYLYNQYQCYVALEKQADDLILANDISGICRSSFIKQDIAELGGSSYTHPSTQSYIKYLNTVSSENLWAHIYARHFADMYGGQLIKKVAPGTSSMYDFEDRSGLIAKVRSNLTDDLSAEANTVFEYVIQLFEELSIKYNI